MHLLVKSTFDVTKMHGTTVKKTNYIYISE